MLWSIIPPLSRSVNEFQVNDIMFIRDDVRAIAKRALIQQN